MDSDSSFSDDFNFGFAFNNCNFSDHILRIEIIPDLPEDTTDAYVRFHLNYNGAGEAPLRDLLNYMYSGSVSATTPHALVDVLMAADKYDVPSCMRYCSKLLLNLPMTCESALFYLHLDLPSSVSMGEAVQPLIDSAKLFLAAHYKDLTKFREEVMKLPLVAIEAIFSSDTLQVRSEDNVYDFLVEWAQLHYPKAEDRRKVFGSRLCPLIRFSYMTVQKFMKVMSTNDYFDPKFALEVVKALASPYSRTHSVERAYKYLPNKVVSFESPRQQCIVYLELKREECLQLSLAGHVLSQIFQLGGQDLYLITFCVLHPQTSLPLIGICLRMLEKGSSNLSLDYEVAARAKPTENYIIKFQGSFNLTKTKALFGMPWTEFIGEDSFYFINGVFHLKADLTLRQRVVAD